MKMAKKAFSVVLALVMLVNVFAAMGSALAPDSAVDLYVEADKATYAPGDEIVFTVSEQVIDEVGEMWIGGQYAFGYDSDVFEPYNATSTTLSDHGFEAIAATYDTSNSDYRFDSQVSTDIIASEATAYGWDSKIIINIVDNSENFSASAKTTLYTFKMKIKADAPDGDYTFGFHSEAFVQWEAYANDATMGGVYGQDPSEYTGYSTTANYGFNNVTIKVGAAAPELDVTAASNQIRYNKTEDGAFAGFDVRTRATIDAAALQELVGVTANDDVEDAIVSAGFVYGADIDAATAATVAAGGSADGYTRTEVSYIQNTGSAYVFTYLVTGLTTENAATSYFEAVGYITLTIDGTDYTFCYDAETAVSPSAMYNSTYERANTTFGWSLTAIS